jgi:hypothetical protein
MAKHIITLGRAVRQARKLGTLVEVLGSLTLYLGENCAPADFLSSYDPQAAVRVP